MSSTAWTPAFPASAVGADDTDAGVIRAQLAVLVERRFSGRFFGRRSCRIGCRLHTPGDLLPGAAALPAEPVCAHDTDAGIVAAQLSCVEIEVGIGWLG